MRLREVKTGVRVRCVRMSDGNPKTVAKDGKIVGHYVGDSEPLVRHRHIGLDPEYPRRSEPLVRFDRSVRGHGYKNREWYCGYKDLKVIG